MAIEALPCPTVLRQLMTLDACSGSLTWKKRPAFTCRSLRAAKAWNTRWAGCEALNYEDRKGYLFGNVMSNVMRKHRVVWAVHYGEWPDSAIDHINGDRKDNRVTNLRKVTDAENSKNMGVYKSNKSGATGVTWEKGKWTSHIRESGRKKHLGVFSDFGDAVAARQKAERELGFHPNHGARPSHVAQVGRT